MAFALLTGHAALVLSGVVQAAGWLPVAESLVASLLGLRLLVRSIDAAGPDAAGVLPARVAAPVGEPIDSRRA